MIIKLKYTVYLLALVSPIFICAQQIDINLKYLVDYEIPVARTNSVDTITIGLSQDGKYLYTDYKKLGLDIAKEFNSKKVDEDAVSSNIIYDTERAQLFVAISVDDNSMFMNMSVASFLPSYGMSTGDDNFELIVEPTGETQSILGQNAKISNLFPATDSNDILSISTSDKFKMNNKKIFEKLFELIFQNSGIQNTFLSEMPEGLILEIADGNTAMLRAVRFEEINTSIKINYSFNIKE